MNKKLLEPDKAVMAPSIVEAGSPPPAMNREMKVEGLGPIGPSWEPRVALAGTYDEVWQKTKWPKLPDDFDYSFFNTAHPDLIYPGYLLGNERISLSNLSFQSEIQFKLPDYILAMLQRFEDGQLVPSPLLLDTVQIDLPQNKVNLVWRGRYSIDHPIRVLEARLLPEDTKVEKKS